MLSSPFQGSDAFFLALLVLGRRPAGLPQAPELTRRLRRPGKRPESAGTAVLREVQPNVLAKGAIRPGARGTPGVPPGLDGWRRPKRRNS
jgi:hypothetical protein